MSKKKNKKFKRSKGSGSSYSASQSKVAAAIGEQMETDFDEAGESLTAALPAEKRRVSITDDPLYQDPRYKMIRRDVKKVLVTISVLVLVLVGAHFVNTRTNLFNSLGDWVYRVAIVQGQ